jgi:hypothetical protein
VLSVAAEIAGVGVETESSPDAASAESRFEAGLVTAVFPDATVACEDVEVGEAVLASRTKGVLEAAETGSTVFELEAARLDCTIEEDEA